MCARNTHVEGHKLRNMLAHNDLRTIFFEFSKKEASVS